MTNKLSPLELSKYWLEEIVIGLDLCPFAKKPYKDGLVRLIENESISESDQLSFFLDEMQRLQTTPAAKLSTTLIIYINDKSDFFEFNDFVGLCEELMIESGLEEHFQLVAFHPEFLLADTDSASRAHWVGRAPYSIIHLLRNSEIEFALATHPDLSNIPEQNEDKLLSLSEEEFNKLFYYLK